MSREESNKNRASDTDEAGMKATDTIYGTAHTKDVNAHRIFGNNKLCCQFLNNYIHIPLFPSILPEDIEEMSERYWAYLGVDYTADTVKKIRFYNKETGEERHVIVIIEHKSYVEYDVSLQLDRYKCMIWRHHGIAQKSIGKGSPRQKDFLYPLVIRIVYYEGKKRWTARRTVSDKTEFPDELKYLTDPTGYELVELRDYTYDDLKKADNIMSVIMMLNKIQSKDDFDEFIRETKDESNRINEIYKNEDEDVKQIFKEVLWSLLVALHFDINYVIEIMTSMEVEGLSYLFENADLMEVGTAYNKMRDEKHRAEEAELLLREERSRADKVTLQLDEERSKSEKEKNRADKVVLLLDEERSKVYKLEHRAEKLEHKVEELTRKLLEYEQNSNS